MRAAPSHWRPRQLEQRASGAIQASESLSAESGTPSREPERAGPGGICSVNARGATREKSPTLTCTVRGAPAALKSVN